MAKTQKSAPEAQWGVIRVESGFYAGLEWPIDRASIVIGRGRSVDLVLNEPTISRAHAIVGYEGNEAFVEDLGSTNGTLVNGVRTQRKTLCDGDELRMGRLVLRFHLEPSEGRAHVSS